MKRSVVVIAFWWVAALCPQHARAQTGTQPTDLPRHDVTFTAGWLNGNKSNLESWNDWYNRGLYGGATAGWYWTDHLKAEIEAGTSNTTEIYGYRDTVVGNVQTYEASEFRFRTRRIAIGQQYQFYRNVWFQPHVTAGADFVWETTTEHVQAISTVDLVTRLTHELPTPADRPNTKLRVEPYAELGYKAYMTPRAFFRNDLRLSVRHGIDQVILRFGFGVDF